MKCAELSVSLDSLVAQASSVAACDLAGETALLHLESGVYYGLDPVGTFIWQQIETPKPARLILDELLASYEVDPAECEADLLRLIQQLQDERLVEIRDAALS